MRCNTATLIAVVAAFGATACFGGFEPREAGACPDIDAVSGERTLLAIGDSAFAWKHQKCRTIPDVVALELGRGLEHRAVNGARFSGGDYEIRSQYTSGDWDWVLLDGGGNDLNNECECGADCAGTLDALVAEDGTRGQIPRLVDEILEDGARVVVYGYFEVGEDANYGFDECIAEIDELRERQSRIVDTRDGVIFVDGRDAVTVDGTPGGYAFDDVHPSKEGARLVGELVARKMRRAEEKTE